MTIFSIPLLNTVYQVNVFFFLYCKSISEEAIKNSEDPNMMKANPSEMEREVFAAVTTKVGGRKRLSSNSSYKVLFE